MRVKKKIVKKKRIHSTAKAERKLAAHTKLMAERAIWARRILKAQDQKTRDAVDEMIEAMSAMAGDTSIAKVKYDNGGYVTLKVDPQIYEDAWVWIAVRLLAVAHEWDIQVANFKPVRKRAA
jgi:hypothetical protein